ncbi:uncharacterized protein J8A68_002088 [[Candida] subhashii]|uniref:Uncharacterized protein n=1 Tax=[Candida] subhashii TaxID=561895 RepID=A0A8J5V1S1_9ASCO|nr:uncharacterized protein J8A68_002088 [[Candida] subhashii]KAG7664414.1 hypothetical protein J8A68_002088 [[Candida] subhashii]
MDHQDIIENALATAVLFLQDLDITDDDLEDNSVQINTPRRQRSVLELTPATHIEEEDIHEEQETQPNLYENICRRLTGDLTLEDIAEGDTRPFPRSTILGEDKMVYLMEFKRKSYKRFIYLHGLLIDENRNIVNPSVGFRRNNGQVLRYLKERGHPLIDLSSKYNNNTRLLAFPHNILWEYVTPRNFQTEIVGNDANRYRRYVRNPLKKTVYQQIKGAKVVIGLKQSFVIYVPRERKSNENHIDLSCRETRGRPKNTIDTIFQGFTFSNLDFEYLLEGIDSNKMKEGSDIYRLINTRVMNDARSSLFHSPIGDEDIFKDYDEGVVNTYSTYFGQFYNLLHYFGNFPFIVDSCTSEDKLVLLNLIQANEDERVEKVTDLFIHFNSINGAAFLKALSYPYLRRFSDGKVYRLPTLLVKLEAIRNVYKFVIFLRTSNQQMSKFSKGIWEPEYMGWSFLATFYSSLLKDQIKHRVIVEGSGKLGRCFVNGITVDKDYISDTYYKSACFYQEKFEDLCRITGSNVLMSEVFEDYKSVSGHDYTRLSLNEGVENGYFFTHGLDDVERRKILSTIDEMTKALACMMLLSCANIFKPAEIFRIKILGDDYSNRDMVFMDGSVLIRQNYVKGKQFFRRLCYTTNLVTKFIIVHVTAVRGLYIRILQPNFPSISEEFNGKQGLAPEEIEITFYKTFLFVSRHGRLLTLQDLNSFQAKLLDIDQRDVLNANILRRSIAWFIKEEMPGGLDYYTAFLKDVEDIRKGRTKALTFARRMPISNHSQLDVKIFFNNFFLFMGISQGTPIGGQERRRGNEHVLSVGPPDKRPRVA